MGNNFNRGVGAKSSLLKLLDSSFRMTSLFCWTQTFFGLKFIFLPKICLEPKSFYPNLFGPSIFLDPIFLDPTLYWNRYVWNQNLLALTNFDPKFFWTYNFWGLNIETKKIFHDFGIVFKIFGQTYFRLINSLDRKFHWTKGSYHD